MAAVSRDHVGEMTPEKTDLFVRVAAGNAGALEFCRWLVHDDGGWDLLAKLDEAGVRGPALYARAKNAGQVLAITRGAGAVQSGELRFADVAERILA